MLREASFQISVKAHDDSDDLGDSFPKDELQARLQAGLEALDIVLPDDTIAQSIEYIEILDRWNRVFNLSAVRDPHDMVVKHWLDSFAVIGHVEGPRVVDLGSGAGFPGMPVALARPECEVILLDAIGKKAQFLRHVAVALDIPNVEVVQERSENYSETNPFDTVLARAFGSLNVIAESGFPLLAPGGRILAMKGKRPDRELRELRIDCQVAIHEITVPGLAGARHLVELRRNQA